MRPAPSETERGRNPWRVADRVGHRWILAIGTASCGIGYLAYLLLLDEAPAT